MTDSFISSIFESIASTPQAIQSTFDYLKEFLQNFEIFQLNFGIFLLSLGYILFMVFTVRLGMWLYKNYKENLSMLLSLLFSIDLRKEFDTSRKNKK